MGWKERYFVFVPPTYWLRSWEKLLKKRNASNMCHKLESSGIVEGTTRIQISWNRGQSVRLSLHGPFTSSRIVPKLEQYKHDARKWPSKLTACHTDALSAKKSLFRWQRMVQVISHAEIIARVWTPRIFLSKLLLFFILVRTMMMLICALSGPLSIKTQNWERFINYKLEKTGLTHPQSF